MKKVLILIVPLLMVANVAAADHIGIYRDASGTSCLLTPGFTTTTAVIHIYSLGATGVRFRVDFANAPGSVFFAFSTPYVPVGALDTDLSIGYGACLSPTIMIGTIVMLLNSGYLDVKPAIGFANILYTDCDFAEKLATGGRAWTEFDYCAFAVEPATWGKVKALYR
jgi:hypothetical protein